MIVLEDQIVYLGHRFSVDGILNTEVSDRAIIIRKVTHASCKPIFSLFNRLLVIKGQGSTDLRTNKEHEEIIVFPGVFFFWWFCCGTFGFMISADSYVKSISDDYCDLTEKQVEFQVKEAFSGGELVHETHRLALMNAMLHNIEGRIVLGDTLSESGKSMTGYDVVLTNPPFGTKKGGERATRDDFTYTTSNKQLNFLQHIYRSLRTTGKARAAVVLPDNVLFADGDGEKIRVDLMNKCNLHTVLRLPTGIFYAQGVKTNVLFFTRGKSAEDAISQLEMTVDLIKDVVKELKITEENIGYNR